MREEPKHLIAVNAIRAWRISAIIYMIILWLLIIGLAVLPHLFAFLLLYISLAATVGAMFTFVFACAIPELRYRRWRYEIFEHAVYLRAGILIMARTLLPMLR